MTGHLASTPTCFDWTASFKNKDNAERLLRSFDSIRNACSLIIFLFCVYFFQWICTKIGRAAKRPRGIWICSTWSEMYVYLRKYFKNEKVKHTNLMTEYYVLHTEKNFTLIPDFVFHFFFQPRLWGIALQTCHLVQFPLVQFTRSPDFLFCSFFGLKNIFLCGIVNLKRIAKFLESPLSLPWERLIAISQALKWISNAVFL